MLENVAKGSLNNIKVKVNTYRRLLSSSLAQEHFVKSFFKFFSGLLHSQVRLPSLMHEELAILVVPTLP